MICALVAALRPTGHVAHAAAPPTLCGFHIDKRPQTVAVLPDLSSAGLTKDDVVRGMEKWNTLWQKYWGFPAFVLYDGDPQYADILITGKGWDSTWVQGTCDPKFVQKGNNRTVVYFGSRDSWRNALFAPHELGHALWFTDFGPASQYKDGMIDYQSCDQYIGVMSYCSSPQSWFLDQDLTPLGIDTDDTYVRDYYSR